MSKDNKLKTIKTPSPIKYDSYHDRIREIKKKSFENLYFKDDDSDFVIVDHRR